MLEPWERWVGPFQIRYLLETCFDSSIPKPPNAPGAYLVTKSTWTPPSLTLECVPLYVGGITGESPRFNTRIGDLLADAFGFYNKDNRKIGHHSGGQSIHDWCRDRISPLDLYLAWVEGTKCHRCLEGKLYRHFNFELKRNGLPKLLNKKAPGQCDQYPHA